MKTRGWLITGGVASVILAKAAVWADAPQARNERPTLTVRGMPGGRVQITVNIPGKQPRGFDVKGLPGGGLLSSEDDSITLNNLTLFLDALPDAAGSPNPADLPRSSIQPSNTGQLVNSLVRRPGSKDLFADPSGLPILSDLPPSSPRPDVASPPGSK